MALTNKTAFSTAIVTGANGSKQSTLGHASIHNSIGSVLNDLQDDVGVDSSTDVNSLKYKVTTHTGASSGVHGVTGAVVGTTDTQTLSNKTLTSVDVITLQESLDSTHAINFAPDVNLYRDDPDVLRTDDNFIAGGDVVVGDEINIYNPNKKINMASTTGGNYDVNLYASNTNTLATDDNLAVAGGTVTVGVGDTTAGQITLQGSAAGSAEGGQVNLATAADHDTTIESWAIDTYEDDLRFFTSNASVTNKMTAEGQLQLPTTTSAGGLVIGGDTNLYRSGANILETDDELRTGTAGTQSTSVVTVGGSQTLTNKTLTSPTLTTPSISSGDLNLATGLNIQVNSTDPYRTITLKPGFLAPTTTTGCATATQSETSTNKINYYSLDFDQTTEEHAFAIFSMPDSWDAGTVQFRVKWTASSGTGGVAWGLSGVSFANDDALDTAVGAEVVVTDTLIATGDIHDTGWSSDVTLAGTPAAGEEIYLEIARVTANGSDTLTGDAKLISVQVRYKQAQFGD